MTSPTKPPKESLRDRVSTRLSTDKRGRLIDDDARHTRNVSWMFYGLIVVIIVIAVAGLGYGFWEANFKPLANVDGTEVSRSQWEDRQKLEAFRAVRAETQVSAAVAEGTIDSDLANRRFSDISLAMPESDSVVMTDLVDLLFGEQLAEEEGITLTEDELEAAIAADGTFPETRLIDALVVITEEQEQGEAATEASIADAKLRAEALLADLRDGGDPATLAETYGPANHQSLYVTDGVLSETAWNDAIFAAEAGEATEVFEGAYGEQYLALVREIVPPEADPGFVEAVNDEVGEGVHRRNVELEATVDKLEDQVTTEALTADYDQVKLAQIFLSRSPQTPDDTEGDVQVSHILYAPETPLDADGNPTAVSDLAEDDPAWAEAQLQAERAARQLSAVNDIETRIDSFAVRARRDSTDGTSASRGGDLGYFPRDFMTEPFNDAIWDAVDAQRGDILGPVRSEYGWHVILFDEFRSSLEVRLEEVQAALAEEGADFAAIAAELSDGPEAADGGETGWQRLDDIDDITLLALSTIDPGEYSEAIDDGDGYRIYQKQDEATRPLEPADAALVARSAFPDWYDDRFFDARAEGRISIDASVYE